MEISVLDSRVKFLLGNIGDEQIDAKALFSYRDNQLNLHLAEMTDSNNNQRAIQITRLLTDGQMDYVGLPSDFFQPIWCDLIDQFGYRIAYVETVNLTELSNRDFNHRAIAFWGTDPVRYRLSWNPVGNITIRIVYEPDTEHAKPRSSGLEIRDLFAWKVACETAADVLSLVDYTPQMTINPNIRNDIKESLLRPGGIVARWRESWNKEIFRGPSQGPAYVRPFSAYVRP